MLPMEGRIVSEYTDDDVTAVVQVMRAFGHPVSQDAAKAALDAVAPAIAGRALRVAADEIADSEVPIYYPSAWLRARAKDEELDDDDWRADGYDDLRGGYYG